MFNMNRFSHQKRIVIFESPGAWQTGVLKLYLSLGIEVAVLEPFHAYHHRQGIRFFPPQLSPEVKGLIGEGKVRLITVRELNAAEIYLLAGDRALNAMESAFARYRRRIGKLLRFVVHTTGSPLGEDVFRINLCFRLAEFYSINLLAARIAGFLPGRKIVFYPERIEFPYFFFQALLKDAQRSVEEHEPLVFSAAAKVFGTCVRLKEDVGEFFQLTVRVILSLLLSCKPVRQEPDRSFKFGMGVIAPARQLRGTQRGADFLVDEKLLRASEVAYFPLARLTPQHKQKLSEVSGNVYFVPKEESYRGRFLSWLNLWGLALQGWPAPTAADIRSAFILFDNYFKWQSVLKRVHLQHFITHCDFGEPHIGRNIALKAAGVETWHFTDSMNQMCTVAEPARGITGCHPFWAYMYYDHFVTWNEFLKRNYERHHCSVGRYHVVGCLWSGHIQSKAKSDWSFLGNVPAEVANRFVVAAFDSTYSCHGITSYEEGITFARDLIKLADADERIFIFLKEKKDRSIHLKLDPNGGRELLEVYKLMDSHPRISVIGNDVDTAKLMSAADLCISFPFTSTTLEALSAGRPALWHDPLNLYARCPYGSVSGVVSHDFAQLKALVAAVQERGADAIIGKLDKNSPLWDPFSDGNAIERFRELLANGKAASGLHEALPVPNRSIEMTGSKKRV